VESFFLPKRVVVKLNEKKPEKSKLIAVGFMDTGPGAIDLETNATLTVGSSETAVPGLVPTANGKRYLYKEKGLVFSVAPDRKGSSRAKFKLKFTGDLTGQVDPEAPLLMRFQCDEMDGRGTCALTKGKYALKKVRGTLIEPSLYLARAKAKIKGGGKDKLLLLLGLATGGKTPDTVDDVVVRFGQGLEVTIPGDSFERNGDRHEFEGNVDGITLVLLDYAKELVKIKGKGLDLGAFDEGPIAVSVGVDVGEKDLRRRIVHEEEHRRPPGSQTRRARPLRRQRHGRRRRPDPRADHRGLCRRRRHLRHLLHEGPGP